MKTLFALLALVTAALANGTEENWYRPEDAAPILMRPFRSMAGGIDIEVVYNKAERIARIEVRSVVPKSAAKKAGIEKGMNIIKIQSTPVIGLTKEEFVSRVLQQGVTEAHVITVLDSSKKIREILIPVRPRAERTKT